MRRRCFEGIEMEAFGKFFQSSHLVFVRIRTQQRADSTNAFVKEI